MLNHHEFGVSGVHFVATEQETQREVSYFIFLNFYCYKYYWRHSSSHVYTNKVSFNKLNVLIFLCELLPYFTTVK